MKREGKVMLRAEPLTGDAFRPFGEVIALETARQCLINQGQTIRFHDLCTIDVADQSGRPIMSVFRSSPVTLPHKVTVMERHPLGSQAFFPLDDDPFLVLVGLPEERLRAEHLRLFVTNGRQGINLFKNTWHHFQLSMTKQRDLLVIDRGGPGNNLQEIMLDEDVWIVGVPTTGVEARCSTMRKATVS